MEADDLRPLMWNFRPGVVGSELPGDRLSRVLPGVLAAGEDPRVIVDKARRGAGGPKLIIVLTDHRLLLLPSGRALNKDPSPIVERPLEDLDVSADPAVEHKPGGWELNAGQIYAKDDAYVVDIPRGNGSGEWTRAIREVIYGPAASPGGLRSDLGALSGCIYLGGTEDLEVKGSYVLAFVTERLSIRSTDDGTEKMAISYVDLVEIEVEDGGSVTTRPRFFGGGFGLLGAVEGMAIASVLNSFSHTKTRIRTVIRLTSETAELFFLYTLAAAPSVRIMLSPAITKIPREKRLREGPGDADPLDRLERLAALHTNGQLSDEEFALAKAKLLESL